MKVSDTKILSDIRKRRMEQAELELRKVMHSIKQCEARLTQERKVLKDHISAGQERRKQGDHKHGVEGVNSTVLLSFQLGLEEHDIKVPKFQDSIEETSEMLRTMKRHHAIIEAQYKKTERSFESIKVMREIAIKEENARLEEISNQDQEEIATIQYSLKKNVNHV